MSQTHLREEIFEQPAALERLIKLESDQISSLANEIVKRKINQIMIAARGTSDNAGRYAQYLLAIQNGMLVSLATPSVFTIYKRPPRLKNALILGISQSGKSPDIVEVLREGRRQNALTAAITNEPHSDLAGEADYLVDLHAGVERSVAATKTYTAELAAIALLSTLLTEDRTKLADLRSIPAAVAMCLEMESEILREVKRYRYMRECVVIGRGYNYATAFELALKLKELTYTFVEPYSSADFLHGPLAIIEHGFPAIVFAPSGAMLGEMQNFMTEIRDRKAELLVISDDAETLALADVPLALPRGVPEWLSPIPAILPGQLLALHLALIRGYDVDHPRGLKKITETH
jgi:glucosamine--fructose-6-phosphate aminotransferase (isomerizing)